MFKAQSDCSISRRPNSIQNIWNRSTRRSPNSKTSSCKPVFVVSDSGFRQRAEIKLVCSLALVLLFGSVLLADWVWTPCVEDETKEAAKRLETPPDQQGVVLNEMIGDADMDGKPDRIIAFKDQCGGLNCYWALFLSNKECVKDGGYFTGESLLVLKTIHNRHRDIKVIWRKGCGGADRVETTFESDGYRYSEAKREEINDCGKESEDAIP